MTLFRALGLTTFLFAFTLLRTPEAEAKGSKFEAIEWGVAVDCNFPSTYVLGAGPRITLFETLTLAAHFDIGKWVLGLMTLQNIWTYGASARIRIPMSKTSPTVGVGWTTTLLQGAATGWFSSLVPGTQRYVTLMFGLEHEFSERLAVGIEYGIPYLLDSSGGMSRQTAFFPVGIFARIGFGS